MNAGMNETGWCTAGRASRVTAKLAAALICASFPLTASAERPDQTGPPASAPGAQKNAAKHEQRAVAGQRRKAAKPRRSARANRRSAAPGQAKRGSGALTQARRQTKSAPSAFSSLTRDPITANARRAATGASATAPTPIATSAAATTDPAGTRGGSRRARAAAAARRRAVISRRRASARRRAAARRAAATPPASGPALTAGTAPALTAVPAGATTAPAAGTPAPSAPRERATADRGESDAPVSVVTRTVTRTVRDIAEVIPDWAKALMVALAALLLVATALIVGTGLRNRRLRRQSAALLDEVGVLQAALLPTVAEHVGALAVSVAYRPAEGLAAGGDFYDVFPLDRGRVGIVVGDVSGHGRESLGPATFIRHMVRSYIEAGLSPRGALQLAGKVVDEQAREDFATVVAAVHDAVAGTLSYATAGHPPPIVVGPGEHKPLTVASSPPIGVASRTGLRQTTLPIGHDSTVCFFTDGLVEARTASGIYGTPALVRTLRKLGPDATADAIIAAVAEDVESLPDDIAVCVVRPDVDASAASTVRVEEIEVTLAELHGERLRRFLDACGVAPEDVTRTITAAAPQVVKHGSALLRVRLAEERSGVDVVPLGAATVETRVTALSPRLSGV